MAYLREEHYLLTANATTTTSATFQSRNTVTFTPEPNTDYYILWTASDFGSAASANCEYRLRNTTDNVTYGTYTLTQLAADKWCVSGLAKYTSGATPSSTSFSVQYRSVNGIAVAGIADANVVVFSAGGLDQWSETVGPNTTTSNTYQDATTLTFTPSVTDDYLILATAELGTSVATTDSIGCRLTDGTTSYGTSLCYDTVTGQNMPWGTLVKVSLTGGQSYTYKVQYNSGAGATSTITNARILALNLRNFVEVAYSESRGRTTTTTAPNPWTTKTTLNVREINPNVYLLIQACILDHGSLTSKVEHEFKFDASQSRLAQYTPVVVTTQQFPVLYFYVLGSSLTTHTILNEFATTNGGDTAGCSEAASIWINFRQKGGMLALGGGGT